MDRAAVKFRTLGARDTIATRTWMDYTLLAGCCRFFMDVALDSETNLWSALNVYVSEISWEPVILLDLNFVGAFA